MDEWTWRDRTYPSATAAIADLIEGYVTDDEKAAFSQRWDLATALVSDIQRNWVAHIGIEEMKTDEEAITVLMTGRREVPVVPWPKTWDYQMPLILLSTDFEPFTSAKLPVGKFVYVVDPTDEVSFLLDLGFIGAQVPYRIGDAPPGQDFADVDGDPDEEVRWAAQGIVRVPDYDDVDENGEDPWIAMLGDDDRAAWYAERGLTPPPRPDRALDA